MGSEEEKRQVFHVMESLAKHLPSDQQLDEGRQIPSIFEELIPDNILWKRVGHKKKLL